MTSIILAFVMSLLDTKIRIETARLEARLQQLKDPLYNFRTDEWIYINDGEVQVDGKWYPARK